jgi:hypothetical protein
VFGNTILLQYCSKTVVFQNTMVYRRVFCKRNQALIMGFDDDNNITRGLIYLLRTVTGKAPKREKTYDKGGISRVYKICCTFRLLL